MSVFLLVTVAALFVLLFLVFRKRLSEYKILIEKLSDMLGEKDVPPLYLFERLKKYVDNLKETISRVEVSRDNFLTILNSLSEPIFILDREGKITFLNEIARELVQDRINPEGRPYYEIFEDYYISEMVEETIKSEEPQEGTLVTYVGNEKKYFHVKVIPVELKSGDKIFVILFHDVTKERKLDEMRREFIATVSHELRTPLTSIHGYAETLLEDDLENKELVKRFLKIIEEESARMTRLINDLLDLEKMEESEVNFEMKDVDLCEVMEYVYKIIQPIAEENEVDLVVECEDVVVRGNKERLIQMLLNLVDNAVKYTSLKEKGEKKVWVRAYDTPDWVVLEVEDTGPGIPKEAQSRIFEKFYRVDKARSRKMGGTGLGLTIVKTIVDKHGGRIEVESEINQGTVMRVLLPKRR
ncbi:MAG: PAS/PAC sensor signal transduction histidine kinase [Thermotoga sp. 47_83]|jgi:two-component system phosphate regulon sensor histidine kinase PhoR|uniref:histidine kinase n=1 Tax=Thermotoga petrophila TaxID=93929 RepID=A0A101ERE6_9THEM|nr:MULTISPECIES: ATP-binding protein [unclassified Thermotoga]KAF2960581.1 PAS domain-containing sensor histidine kinase [Thermotoga sp. 38H-to]KHC92427.1 sensor histidine kinase HpkA [Thermotoga sp. Mc24]KUK23521.1 MAG: PAS/PAC sensor signal transduction histidine kinase [Thermotoga petrophila]KUK33807.1 MAG: PAS/PAC sensor signal transduction histidine kinase [Thermotoga sp. 47_83]